MLPETLILSWQWGIVPGGTVRHFEHRNVSPSHDMLNRRNCRLQKYRCPPFRYLMLAPQSGLLRVLFH
jgi:hypothetical protein